MPIVFLNTPMSEALIEMSQKSMGVVAVLSETGTLAGIITDGDLRRHMDGLLNLTAADVIDHFSSNNKPGSVSCRSYGPYEPT